MCIGGANKDRYACQRVHLTGTLWTITTIATTSTIITTATLTMIRTASTLTATH